MNPPTTDILLIGLTLGLFSCNSTTDRQEKSIVETLTADSISVFVQTNEGATEEELGLIDYAVNCVRGQAEPIINKKEYPNTTFLLQPDSLTAFETVNFDNGDKLIIHNSGCEYYVLTFRFETTQYQQDTTNFGFWFKSANRLMTGMLSGLDAPIDIKSGITHLDWYIDRDEKNKFKNLKLGDEVDFGGEDIRNFVTVDRIEKISDKKYAVEISFTTGPL